MLMEMVDQTQNLSSSGQDEELSQSFESLLEQGLPELHAGEILPGKVVRIDQEWVMVDVGYKCEGQIPAREFKTPNGTLTIQEGDEIPVMIERLSGKDGLMRLSYRKAIRIQTWEKIQEAHKEGTPIEGIILERIKGGFSVDLGGVRAFLPFSQADIRPVRDPEVLIGLETNFKVLKYNRKRDNVVVSRRELLEEELKRKQEETLASLEEGQVREGVVKNITDYGVFVDLGGIDGLLHVSDISWGRVEHPGHLFKVGDKITVKVLKFDREKRKISLGIKQLTPDPWESVEEKYPLGSKVQGKVVNLTDYGAFVELEPGVEGLIHISEMSWTKKVRHPKDVLQVGDVVTVAVIGLDPEARRISLSLKQVEPNPWDIVMEKFPPGTTIETTIKNITDFGLFVGIMEGIDGFIHISDISWSRRLRHPADKYKVGDTIQAVVLNIDREKERFSLGIKQLTPDPWESVEEKYPVGTKVTGTVTNVTDFGVFVEIEEGIEGLIHVSELSDKRLKSAVGTYEVGDKVTAKVINLDPERRKMGLSIRRMAEDEERSYYLDYVKESSGATTTLGALLKEGLTSGKK
ncbi:30S ribosomal protein S1 [Thermosulfuriphilus ammonigenes]|uniref:Small ribosomal subunit protein bS1 n=2 Tax=Thermosulfuriphilus ammonigenes TaxID=1936021 RepID=A0A6G7PZB3_9BACT|nr:30S ribosomal protein S1 [Thermosulfuriphilus ammonigenes]